MKKVVHIIIGVMLFCALWGINYAASMNITYDGAVHAYNEPDIQLFVNGQLIETQVMPPIKLNNTTLVPAKEVFEPMGASVQWLNDEKKIYINEGQNNIILTINAETAQVNGQDKRLYMPAKLINGKVMIPIRFISENLGFSVQWIEDENAIIVNSSNGSNPIDSSVNQNTNQNINQNINSDNDYNETDSSIEDNDIWNENTTNEDRTMQVVIDAGHGGNAPGTCAAGIQEKDLTLSYAQALNTLLQQDSTITSYMTRDADVSMSLNARCKFSNEKNPDLFISIHINSAGSNTAPHGTETYYYTKADTRNKAFATIVQKHLIAALGTNDRKVKVGDFQVIRETKNPSILIEVGFLSNADERAMMTEPGFAERLAEAIYDSIKEYQASGQWEN